MYRIGTITLSGPSFFSELLASRMEPSVCEALGQVYGHWFDTKPSTMAKNFAVKRNWDNRTQRVHIPSVYEMQLALTNLTDELLFIEVT